MSGPVVFGTTGKVESLLDTNILPRFQSLPQFGKVAAEYVWIGGSGSDLRSKTKTLEKLPKSLGDLPKWNYDGSSTGQAPGKFPSPSPVGKEADAWGPDLPWLQSCRTSCRVNMGLT